MLSSPPWAIGTIIRDSLIVYGVGLPRMKDETERGREKDAKLAHKLGRLQLFLAVFSQ